MTNITRLSPETILEIMELLDLSDICTLIKTSSLFLQDFLTHREQLLKSTVINLDHRLAGCDFSIFLSALRLRCRQPISASASQSEVREAEQASLRLYRHKYAGNKLSTTTELGLICSAQQLLNELEWVMDSYAPKAWYVMQDSEIGEPGTEALIFSVNERRRLVLRTIAGCSSFLRRLCSKETSQYGRCFLTNCMNLLWRKRLFIPSHNTYLINTLL